MDSTVTFAGQEIVGFSTGGGGGGVFVLGLPPHVARANVPAKTSTLGRGERADRRSRVLKPDRFDKFDGFDKFDKFRN